MFHVGRLFSRCPKFKRLAMTKQSLDDIEIVIKFIHGKYSHQRHLKEQFNEFYQSISSDRLHFFCSDIFSIPLPDIPDTRRCHA